MTKEIFMDHVSTTACDKRVVEAMLPYFSENYGNPASQIHTQGVKAQKAVDDARDLVADFVGAKEYNVVFTSGATEANNLALLGLSLGKNKEKNHILVSEVEHFSVFNTMYPLKAHGFEVEIIPVDENGVVTPEALSKKIKDNTRLVSVMHANGEIGTIQPIFELAKIAHEKGALFHTDATISAGLLPLNMEEMGIDAATLSAHNYYGPKGVGALVFKKGLYPKTRSYGGWQEDGFRSGTENVPGIVGMGEASKLAKAELSERAEKLNALQKKLMEGLAENVRFIRFTGHKDIDYRLPGHVSFWVEHVEGESLILFLNTKGIMAASGSACSSNMKAEDEEDLVSSHVLSAVGVPTDICAGSVTLSMGLDNDVSDVDTVLAEFPPIVERLLMMSPSYADYTQSVKG